MCINIYQTQVEENCKAIATLQFLFLLLCYKRQINSVQINLQLQMISTKDPNLKKKMEGEEEVKLLGFWVSAFSHRVIWALELKGIDYRYIEEDINKKSPLLLDANPVHKKIPVLFHRGRAIAESIVILEYIEETWPEKKPLMPADPYQRALARFWIKFGEDHMIPIFGSSLITIEEEQDKAAEEARELLRFLEENCLGNRKFFGGDAVGIMDLAFGWLAYCIEPTEAAAGVKLMDRHALPRMCVLGLTLSRRSR